MKLFWIWASESDIVYKDFYILAPIVFCSAGQNHMCNFGGGHYGEHLCKYIIYPNRIFD